jgi:Ca2+-binding RTX toxin-like protein
VNFLTGGSGADTFEFQKNAAQDGPISPRDVITDFDKNEDVISLFDTYMGSGKNTAVNVGSDASGDVQITFSNTTVVLEGVQNAGYHSVHDLTNAGIQVQDTHF